MRSIKLVTGFLVLLFCSYGWAQDTLYVNPVKIDSIKALLVENDTESIERVELLNDYARLSFYNRELIQGFTATIEARNLSKKIDYKEGEILYHETLAAYIGDGDMFGYHHQKDSLYPIHVNNL